MIQCCCFSLLCIQAVSQHQTVKATGVFNGIYSEPLFLSTSKSDIEKTQFHYSFQSLYLKGKSSIRQTSTLKNQKMWKKLSNGSPGETNGQANKITAITPSIGNNFKGNELKTWTPTDNAIAISNGGIIVSCVNYGVEYYLSNGTPLLQNFTWNDFVNNALLDQGKFDPRVIYDNQHDRFIIVLLHGFSSTTSKILVCFSKTNNPMDGWNIYQMSGNPYQEGAWSDYPTIGVNNDELFINCNRFGNAPNYDFKKTFIYQIGLAEGYAGNALQYGLWNHIYTPDNQDGLTLCPASDGMGNSLSEKMYFVQMMPDSGSFVYLYELQGKLSSPNKTFTASQYAIPHFEVCANALQKDPSTGFLDSLSTGNAWVQNAFYLNNTIHFISDADIGNGWCGIQYGRIYLDSAKAVVTQFGDQGTDLAYPAIASFAHDINDAGVVIAYTQSDSTITPQCGVISVDDGMNWSSLQTVKTGDTVVNILYPPNYAIQPERWGDYTGICRKYNATQPEAWMGAAYGANTPPRLASYGTWIAQLISNEPASLLTTKQEEFSINMYPNPATDMFTLEFDNTQAGIVKVFLRNAEGKLVKLLLNDYLRVSKNTVMFNKLALPNGVYFVEIQMGDQQLISKKLIINH